jgi:impB/mucB/samB family protein
LSRDLTSLDDMRAELGPLVEEVWHYCDSMGVRGRTVTLKVKFADFQIITRSRSHQVPISDRSTLASISAELVAAQFPMRKGVRLIGVSPSSLCADAADVDTQMTLALSVRPHRRAVEYSPPIWIHFSPTTCESWLNALRVHTRSREEVRGSAPCHSLGQNRLKNRFNFIFSNGEVL